MTISELTERWISVNNAPDAEITWWNSKAAAFASKELATTQNSLAMRLIHEHHMIKPNQTVLDIGCGSGRLSFALEQLGARVTGIDFSPQMIAECEKKKKMYLSSSSFHVLDWNSVTLQQHDWCNKFDLVLANMTPAINSADTFLKMLQASRNWCLMVKPLIRNNSIYDKLSSMLGIKACETDSKTTLLYALELLWLNDAKPQIEYEEQCWETHSDVFDAIQEYRLKFSRFHALSESQNKMIENYLHSISVQNTVTDVTHTTIAAIYWKV